MMVPPAYKASICNKPECQFLLAAWWTVDGCKNRISDKNFCSKNVNLPRSLFINVCRILLPPKYFLSIFITKMKSVRYYLIYNWKIFDKYFILTDRKYFHLKILKRTIIIFWNQMTRCRWKVPEGKWQVLILTPPTPAAVHPSESKQWRLLQHHLTEEKMSCLVRRLTYQSCSVE